jgi:hypothetical protein
MKNKLIVIGWMGVKTAYLNVPKEEAINRYMKSNFGTPRSANQEDLADFDFVQEFEFEDEFGTYDAWK